MEEIALERSWLWVGSDWIEVDEDILYREVYENTKYIYAIVYTPVSESLTALCVATTAK